MTVERAALSRLGGTLPWLWLLLLTVESGAQIGLKVGSTPLAGLDLGTAWLATALSSRWVLVGAGCYVLSFAAWMLILDRMPLSLAFPMSGAVYIVVLLVSAFGLGERLGAWHWLGASLIVMGIMLLGQDEL